MSILRSCARFLPPALCVLVASSAAGQTAFQYQFNLPFSVVAHPDGTGVSILVSERGNHRVHKYRADGTLIWRIGNLQGGAGNDEFREPGGLAVDSAGKVYVADTGNARVHQLSPGTGASMLRWGSSGTGPGQFRKPIAIAIDGRDHVYVLDGEARRVQKFSNDGATLLGSWGGTLGSGDGAFSPIGSGPGDIVLDTAGNAFISDTSNHRIHKWRLQMDAAGNITGATFAGWLGKCVSGANCDSSTQRSRGFDCTAATCVATSPSGSEPGQFTNPRGLALDPAGNLFVADVDNNRIQQFNATGAFVRAWGIAGSYTGQFRGPLDVASDGNNAVYVADMRNGRVVKFSNSGDQLSVLGGGVGLSAMPGWPPDKKDALLDAFPFFVVAGNSQPTTITVESLGEFAGPVTLSADCPSPPTVASGCLDLLTGLPAAQSGTTVAISPNPVTAPAGYKDNASLTVTASASATPGKFIRRVRGENQPAGIVQEMPIALEVIAAPTDSTTVPCASTPGIYQRGTLPEILPLAPVLTSLYRDKHGVPWRSRALVIAASATATRGVGWTITLAKPRPADLPLLTTEAVIVFSNPSRGTKGIYALNVANCTITKGVAIDVGMPDEEFRISTSNTTTLFFSVPRQDIAILSEPSFWQLVGGRRVTIAWVGN